MPSQQQHQNTTTCELQSTFLLSAQDDLAVYNSLVQEWCMGGWYIQHIVRRGKDLTADEAEDIIRAMRKALRLQDAIRAYCGEDVFVHSRNDAIARWTERVGRSTLPSRADILRSSERLLRVAPVVPKRTFTEERSFSLDKRYVDTIRDTLHHQWFRGTADFRSVMRSVVDGIGYWRKADNGMFGYGAIARKVKDLLVVRSALEGLFRHCPPMEIFPGDIVLWFDSISAGVVDTAMQSRLVADLGILLDELPIEVRGLADIAEEEEYDDFMY